MQRGVMRRLMVAAIALAAAAGVPQAYADVKDGVDAWGRGDYEAAVAQWAGPAAKGDPDALFNMGQAYKLGRGVPKDLARAEDFYARAARKGQIRAADNYGILLFQTRRQAEAIPWLTASADRGEPRAMYILGIAAYNGDYVAKDPVRAYALLTRASAAGLDQANASLAAMNEALPLETRQQGAALAEELDRKAAAARQGQMAGADLGAIPAAEPAPTMLASRDDPQPVERTAVPGADPSTMGDTRLGTPVPGFGATPLPRPRPASRPVTAGADYANPVTLPPHPAPAQAPVPTPAPRQAAAAPHTAPPAHEAGGWRVQLGAFGQKSNADALWARLHGRPELAGHARIDAGSPVTRLMAGGYSEEGAKAACAALKAAGQSCLAVNR